MKKQFLIISTLFLSVVGFAQTPAIELSYEAAGKARFGFFEFGFFLHTGEANEYKSDEKYTYFGGGNITDPNRSNGIFYFGISNLKFGWDSEGIRHDLQNGVAHDGLSAEPKYGEGYPWILRVN